MEETKIKQTIGQLEASIDKIEPYVTLEEFKDYCDATYTSIAMWRVVLLKIKKTIKDGTQA